MLFRSAGGRGGGCGGGAVGPEDGEGGCAEVVADDCEGETAGRGRDEDEGGHHWKFTS